MLHHTPEIKCLPDFFLRELKEDIHSHLLLRKGQGWDLNHMSVHPKVRCCCALSPGPPGMVLGALSASRPPPSKVSPGRCTQPRFSECLHLKGRRTFPLRFLKVWGRPSELCDHWPCFRFQHSSQ